MRAGAGSTWEAGAQGAMGRLFEGTETVSCRLSCATDGTDGNGLKLEKIGQFFHILILRVLKILKKCIKVSPL